MSEKKGLKQSRLPFQIITTSPKITSEQKPLIAENSSPRTPVVSRKRKPSSDGDVIMRSSKIGRRNSKENIIAEQEHPIEIVDSDDGESIVPERVLENESAISSSRGETTPTTVNKSTEVRKIRIGRSCTKKKQLVKPEEQDDSVVYLSEEELQKPKKSIKKSGKRKLKAQKASKDKKKKVQKSLNLSDQAEKASDFEPMEVDGNDFVIDDDDENDNSIEIIEKDRVDLSIIKAQLEENITFNKEKNCAKNLKVVLRKVDVPEESNDELDADVSKNISVEASSKQAEDQPGEATSSTEENPTIEQDKQSISEEISKLVDKSFENGESDSKELQDDIVDVLTDDEKPSPTLNASVINTTPKLTPKALARRKEQESRRIEKELQRQKEKDDKEKQRLKEKEMREEAKKKEREEKEEMRKREKEEKEKKRQAELEKKEEERRQKEEEKRLKEEERKRMTEQKEEEKRQKEEDRKRQKEAQEGEKKKKEFEKIKEEERKKKAAEAFSKFFVPSKKKNEPQIIDDEASKESAESSETTKGNFMPFQIHGMMRLAPRVRTELSVKQKDLLDSILNSGAEIKPVSDLYLRQIKNIDYVPKSSEKTWPQEEEEKDDDITIIDDLDGVGEDIKEDEAHFKVKYRAKFLLFHENKRPAFYGTWRKKSKVITSRRPFILDAKFFDYEVDSDDEWEEEEPGESLHGSDSEKEKNDEDYEVDNDFFVPHGHLSEEEMQHDDEIMEDNSPETQKAKLKVLQQEFAAEMKKKTEKIKPRLIGCIWMNGDEDEDGGSKIGSLEKKYHCSDIIWRILKAREMMSSGEPIKVDDFEPEIIESEDDNNHDEKPMRQKTPAQNKVRPKIEGQSEKELITLLHGNINSKKFLIKEFQAYRLKNYHKLPDFQEYLFKSIDEKIVEISVYKTCPDEGALFGKKCWYVREEIIKKHFGDEKLPLPNQWTYILKKEKKVKANPNKGDSKKGSREVSPNTEQVKIKENPQSTEAPKLIPESPKVTNPLKMTSFVKSSPKTLSSVASKDTNQSSKTPTQKKPAAPNQTKNTPKSTTIVQNKSAIKISTQPTIQAEPSPIIGNGSPKIQASSKSTQNTASSGRKRVALLMSVKPGQSIDVNKKNLLVNNFIKVNQNKEVVEVSNVDDIIEIID